MKELDFLEIIKNKINNSSYIGDDCAFLSDLDIFVTQDTIVQDIHFSLDTITPYLLGRKAVSVNFSDLSAALADPKYITISISVPKLTKNSFIEELYRGINDICNEFNADIIGGDITGSDKVVISVCAIGKKVSQYITSRSYAKKGDFIVATGSFGASAAGLHSLQNFLYADDILINAHLNPIARVKEAKMAAEIINSNIAAMDCSDGLIDSLYKIALSSKHSLSIDMNKVPVKNEVKEYCFRNNLDYKKLVKWGGEDYELILCVSEEIYNKLDKNLFTLIGKVQNKDTNPSVIIINGNNQEKITKSIFETNSFNHF